MMLRNGSGTVQRTARHPTAGAPKEAIPLMVDSEYTPAAVSLVRPYTAQPGKSAVAGLAGQVQADGAGGGGASVHGRVRHPDGTPVSGATVTVIDGTGRQAARDKTGRQGAACHARPQAAARHSAEPTRGEAKVISGTSARAFAQCPGFAG